MWHFLLIQCCRNEMCLSKVVVLLSVLTVIRHSDRRMFLPSDFFFSISSAFFLIRFFLMYLINKDETEHTGQVRHNSPLLTFSEESSANEKQRDNYYSVAIRDTVCLCFKRSILIATLTNIAVKSKLWLFYFKYRSVFVVYLINMMSQGIQFTNLAHKY